MRRLVDPAVLVFVAALIGSLGLHLPVYEVLGDLAARLALLDAERADERARGGEDVEMELVVEPPPPEARPEDGPSSRPVRSEPERRPPEVASVERVEPPPAPVVPPPTPAPPQPRPETAPPEHAITQRSRDPNVEPPPDTRFAAEENNRVEEETVARERNMVRDDPETEPAPSERPRDRADDPGEEEDELAAAEDREGEERRGSPAEAPQRMAAVASTPPAGGAPEESPAARRGESEPAAREGGGEDSRYETITIRDGNGTFVVRRPRAQGAGEGSAGGVAVTGPAGRRRVDEGERGGAASGRRHGPVNLRVGYAALEQIVGREALEEERRAYAEHRRSRRRGPDHAESWRRFRAAIENFVPNVRTGNQTALNARASPFAAYTAEVHRRLHGPFHDFLVGLAASGPLANPELETKLEIVLNRDGTIHQVGVVRQSGQILFDHGAFAAVHSGAPYPIAPDAILSGDGRVYFRWTFKRVEPFCHQILSERYILDNASEATPARSGAAHPGSAPSTAQPHGRAPSGGQRSSGGST